jgi:hypothetical protein
LRTPLSNDVAVTVNEPSGTASGNAAGKRSNRRDGSERSHNVEVRDGRSIASNLITHFGYSERQKKDGDEIRANSAA